MREFLESIKVGKLEDFVTLYDALMAKGQTMELVRTVLAEKRAMIREMQEQSRFARSHLCKVCGVVMQLSPVNTGPRDQTGDNSTFVWWCPKCGEEEWTKKTLKELIDERRA